MHSQFIWIWWLAEKKGILRSMLYDFSTLLCAKPYAHFCFVLIFRFCVLLVFFCPMLVFFTYSMSKQTVPSLEEIQHFCIDLSKNSEFDVANQLWDLMEGAQAAS